MKTDPAKLQKLLATITTSKIAARVHGDPTELRHVQKEIRSLAKNRIPAVRTRRERNCLYVWTDHAIAFQPAQPEKMDWPRFWLSDDCSYIRGLRTNDELLQAFNDLATAEGISEEKINRGFAVIRQRLRQLTATE